MACTLRRAAGALPRSKTVTPSKNCGRSARGRWTIRQATPRYLSGWTWDPPVILIFLLTSSRAERSSSARAVVAPSVDLPPPTTKLRFLVQEPSSAPPPPSQTPSPASPRPESSPATAGHHGRCLKPCSTVDPLLRSSSARTDRGNGFVVSSLCSPVFFPFCGVSPAPVNGRRRRRRPCCCRLGRGSEIRYRGRSAWDARTVRRSG